MVVGELIGVLDVSIIITCYDLDVILQIRNSSVQLCSANLGFGHDYTTYEYGLIMFYDRKSILIGQ